MRQAALLVGLTLTGLLVILLTGPTAGAAEVHEVVTASPGGNVTLASTGFNITGPVIVGLCFLVAGIALVCWAFLRGSSPRHRERRP